MSPYQKITKKIKSPTLASVPSTLNSDSPEIDSDYDDDSTSSIMGMPEDVSLDSQKKIIQQKNDI